MIKIPQIIGHRGAASYAPENTLEGLHSAADMGIEWVEFDVKLTKDQIPVLFHDDTLDRTTSSTGNVADYTFNELRELDVGSWFSDSFIDVKIPTLEEAVDVLLERDLGFNLEIKPCPGREKETAEVVMDALANIWDDTNKVLISSFSHVSLETAFDLAPQFERGLLLPHEWPENWHEMAEYLQVSTIHLNGNECERDQVEMALELGKPILAYTINEAFMARKLQGWGVSGFFTDAPDVLLEGLFKVH